ncbi:hypothetical protein MRB53_038673 [Persea americana]|nr:hypothetical protein MRB53_038673 [Persea americana]
MRRGLGFLRPFSTVLIGCCRASEGDEGPTLTFQRCESKGIVTSLFRGHDLLSRRLATSRLPGSQTHHQAMIRRASTRRSAESLEVLSAQAQDTLFSADRDRDSCRQSH